MKTENKREIEVYNSVYDGIMEKLEQKPAPGRFSL